MIANPQLYLLWTAISVLGYWLLPPRPVWPRRTWLIATSVLLVILVAPYAAIVCLAMTLIAWGWSLVWPRKANLYLLWAGVVTSAAPLLLLRLLPIEYNPLIALGIPFLTFKSVGTVVDSYLERKRVGLGDVLLLNYFFPIYSAGPIETLQTLSGEKLAVSLTPQDLLEGSVRIALGLFKSAMVCGSLLAPYMAATFPGIRENPSGYTALQAFAFVFINFTYVYINFSGYTDIAVGVGRLLGLNLTENFNLPFLATNIQRFWQRWHMSLGYWVLKYLYFPMIRVSGRVFLPIVITFFLVGFWHDSTSNYLIWGACHGLGLGFVQALDRRRRMMPAFKKLSESLPYKLVSWAITMTFVSVLSAVANVASPSAAWSLVRVLVGAGS